MNDFAQHYRRESTLPLTPKKARDMKENLKPKKAPEPDGVSNGMLKYLGFVARKMLLEIFNRSWNNGAVPEVWKTAYLVPVLKKGKDKTNLGSYRLISLLSCVGKFMERIITSVLETKIYSAPHRQDTINIVALKISSHSSLRTFKTPSKRRESCWWSSLTCQSIRLGVDKRTAVETCREQECQVKCTDGSAAFSTTEWPE